MSVQHKSRHTFPRVLGRFVSGRPMDGRPRTNSTFLHGSYGPKADLTHHGRSARWHHWAGWKRAAIRVGLALAFLGTVYGRLHYWAATVHGLMIAGILALAAGIWIARRKLRLWSHTRKVVQPLYATLAMIVGHPTGDNPSKYLTIPPNYAGSQNAVVKFIVPPTWEGTINDQKRVTSLVARRLGGDWNAQWFHDAFPPRAEFRPAPAPPGMVTFAEFRPHMDKCASSVLPLGFGTGNSIASIDLDSESPHIAISAGTGGAKSDTTALIIAYLVNRGCERIDIIDPKRVSHSWAKGLPGVYIHKYVAAQMEAIQNARILMDARYDALEADETITFKRHVLIIEEQNSFIEELEAYWEEYRQNLSPADRGRVPRKNPAIADLKYILNKGRQCCINVISIYQRMSARAAMGGDARENYGAKILARFSPQTWKILVGTTPVPRSSRVPGRAMFVLGDEIHAIQRAYAGIADKHGHADPAGIARLRAYALDGRPDSREPGPGPEPARAGMPDPDSEYVTLREACDSNVIPLRYAAARKARQRALQRGQGFPAGLPGTAGTVYRAGDLRAWYSPAQRAA